MRSKWANAAVLALGMLLGAAIVRMEARLPKVVRAQEFELVDANGKLLAVLGRAEGGGHGLLLVDKNEKLRASLGVTWDGEPGLNLIDKDEKPLVSLELMGQNAWLMLLDEKTSGRAFFELRDGEPGLALYDENGKLIWRAPPG